MTVSAAVLGQEESSEPRPRCDWNPFTLECQDPPPPPTPTPPRPPKPDPDCTFDTSTFTWECPEPTATATPRPTATNTPRPTATNTPRPTETPRPTPRPRPTARPATATPTPTPASRGWLTASQTTIDVGGSTTVRASWEPPGLATWLGIASDSTAVLGRSSQCSGTRFVDPPSEATLTVYGCQGGTGTVELRAVRSTGPVLASITITVRTPPTPRGELSATKTAIDVGEEVTVSAVNVFPSSQSVYIVTNGQLDFAGPGTCHFEINPRSSEKSAKSWTLEGCSPPGSGSVTLKTRHNGNTVVLDSITIDVRTSPTPTDTPTAVPTATTTDPVDPCRSPSDNRIKCTPLPTPTPTPRPITLDTPGNFRSILGPGAGEITLTWDAVAGATGYEVEQKKGRPFPLPDQWKPFPFDNFTATTTGTQAVVGGLKNDKSYHHRVRAVSAHGESEWAEVTTDLSERRKPGGLIGSVEPGSIGEITLQWGAVAEPTRYEVEQKKVRDYWFDDWETLLSHNSAITITGSQAVVGNLKYGPTYEHRVRSLNAAGPSSWSSSVETDLSLEALGHQQDHTVGYRIGSMTVAVGPPSGVPNPASIVPQAVPTAAAAWNAKMSALGLLICRVGTGSCDDENTDGHTTTVKLMDDSPDNPNANDTCARGSHACVQSVPTDISGHVGDNDLVLEEPAWGWGERYRWTLVVSLDGRYIGSTGERWASVGVTLIHEFGQTLGIPDLGSVNPDGTVNHAGIMSNDRSRYPNIEPDDIDYLRKIYFLHVRGQ